MVGIPICCRLRLCTDDISDTENEAGVYIEKECKNYDKAVGEGCLQLIEDGLENGGRGVGPSGKKPSERTFGEVDETFHGGVRVDAQMLGGREFWSFTWYEDGKPLTIDAIMNMEEETANTGMLTFAKAVRTWVRLRHRTKVDMANMNTNRPGRRFRELVLTLNEAILP
jgi:hypothetical protein